MTDDQLVRRRAEWISRDRERFSSALVRRGIQQEVAAQHKLSLINRKGQQLYVYVDRITLGSLQYFCMLYTYVDLIN